MVEAALAKRGQIENTQTKGTNECECQDQRRSDDQPSR